MRFKEMGLPPQEFIELCNPLWARIYIELSHDNHGLPWSDQEVERVFLSLTGFNMFRMQFASEHEQRQALSMAREAEHGLFAADEKENLDGDEAIDFCFGWMAAATLTSSNIHIDDKTLAAQKAAMSHPEAGRATFLRGFAARLEAQS